MIRKSRKSSTLSWINRTARLKEVAFLIYLRFVYRQKNESVFCAVEWAVIKLSGYILIILQYLFGLICLAYLANYVLSK